MKVTFEFNTDDENFDRYQLEAHHQAENLVFTLSKITDKLREWYKYDNRSSIPIEEVYDSIWDIIQDNNINMEKLGY